tara:strand:- start:1408 stop:2661 length:1254 start_codon:yes stop_codon:yes gene_type:complete
MPEIRFCSKCLYGTSHPLSLTLDDDGVCSGCRIHEEKDRLDWSYRWQLLESICNDYRSISERNYDCIVPVSGGQDSYYIVHIVKERLRLNPLLVTYNKYFNTELGIRNLANLRIRFDCDILYQNINPLLVKKITRSSLRGLGSIYWPIIAGSTVFPVQTAIRYRIPLIIWGAHQGLEQVGMFSHENEVEMNRRYRKEHDLMGVEAEELVTGYDVLEEGDVWQYRYPSDSDLEAVGVRGIYLGNYIRWDPKHQHELMIHQYNYQTSRFKRTFDCYDYVDCYNYMDLHDWIKLFKHGYSKVTDHAVREIRFGRLTREQGLELVRQHELEEPEFVDLFCTWLGMDLNSLQFLLDQYRNPLFWEKIDIGGWTFKGWSTRQDHTSNLPKNVSKQLDFRVTSKLDYGKSTKYVTIGKGWPDIK